MDFLGRLIAGFLAVIMVVLFPLQYIAQASNENVDSLVDMHTQKVTEMIRSKGYIDKAMYEDYINFLNKTDEIYDVDIEDIHPVTGEEDKKTAINDTGSTQKDISIQNMKTTDLNVSLHKTNSIDQDTSLQITNNNDKYESLINTDLTDKNIFLHSITPKLYTFSSISNAILDLQAMTGTSEGTIHSLSVHTHTADCYLGHNHTASGCIYHNHYSGCYCNGTRNVYAGEGSYQCGTFYPSKYQCNNCSASYSSNQSTCTASTYVICQGSVSASYYSCTTCGYGTSSPGGSHFKSNGRRCYGSTYIASVFTCSSCGATYATSQTSCSASDNKSCGGSLFASQYTCNHCSTTSTSSGNHMNGYFLYKCNQCSSSVMGDYGSECTVLRCGYNLEGWSCDSPTDDTSPICNTVVTSITAAYLNQSVIQGGNMAAVATATYLDGHTSLVNCTISNFNSNLLGTQIVTLSYYGLVDNARTTRSKSCMVPVTVIRKKSLTSISVTPSVQIISRLEAPSFTVKAIYSDSSRILNDSEFTIEGFDSTVNGPQNVSIIYTEDGITQTAPVTVLVNALTGISVAPSVLSVERYTRVSDLPITVIASHMYMFNIPIKGYTISGYSPDILGIQNVTVTYTERDITQTANIRINVTVLHRTCPYCHNTYDMNTDDSDPGCPFCKKTVKGISVTPDYVEATQGGSLPITVQADYVDGSKDTVSGWTSNYDSTKTGLQIITVEYGGYAASVSVWVKEKEDTCPICGNKYPVSVGKCPVCASTVVSISVNPNKVTVDQYDNINLTVTALYADGSSNTVTDWSIDCSTSNPGNYKATVTYRNVSTKIDLSVNSLTSAICPICGKVYEPSDYPKGCPVCSNTLTGIEAYLTSGSNLVQYGSVPNISVVLIYLDNHREITTQGYILKNYKDNKLGKQTLMVQYAQFETSIDIEVVDTLTTHICPKGHVYYLNENGSDLGCPYCAMADNIGTVYYYDITYSKEILDKIYSEGSYHFASGNYVTINVIKKDVSLLTKIQNTFLKTAMLGRKRKYTYGGEVF